MPLRLLEHALRSMHAPLLAQVLLSCALPLVFGSPAHDLDPRGSARVENKVSVINLIDKEIETAPLISNTASGFAYAPTPTCPGGTDVAPQRLMWNVMYEPYKDGTPRGNDLSALQGTAAGELLCVCACASRVCTHMA